MTKDEIQNWIKNHQPAIDYDSQHDGCSNEWESRIYQDGEKFYRVEFINGHPFEKRSERGYIRGEYSEPVEVVKKQRVVDYYEEAD